MIMEAEGKEACISQCPRADSWPPEERQTESSQQHTLAWTLRKLAGWAEVPRIVHNIFTVYNDFHEHVLDSRRGASPSEIVMEQE